MKKHKFAFAGRIEITTELMLRLLSLSFEDFARNTPV
jgi:hypothetical protein